MLWTEWLINNTSLFLRVLESGGPRTRLQQNRCLMGTYFQVDKRVVFLLCPYMVEGARELSGVSFIRALIPFMRDPHLQPNHFPKSPPLNNIPLGLGFNRQILEGHKYSVYSTMRAHVCEVASVVSSSFQPCGP